MRFVVHDEVELGRLAAERRLEGRQAEASLDRSGRAVPG